MDRLRDDLASAVEQSFGIASSTQLWPGWDVKGTPIVLHSPEIAYVIGHPSPPPGYEEIGRLAGQTVFAGPRLSAMAANTARTISGALCALIMLPAEPLRGPSEFARLILHECFHVYQRQALSRVRLPDWTAMGRYPEGDAENNAMSIVENQILCTALRGRETHQAAAEFLSVRQARHDRLRERALADICDYEQGSEFNEGAPTYVETRAGQPLDAIVDSLMTANIGGKWAASRRFYYTGAAIALVLDVLAPGWQCRLADGGHTLQSLLTDAVAGELPSVEEVLQRRDYAEILASEQAREKERKARIDAMYSDLTSGPGIPLEIEVPEGAFTLYDPTNVVVVEAGTRFHTSLCGLRGGGGIIVDINRLCLECQGPHRLVVRVPESPMIGRGRPFSLSGPGVNISAGVATADGPGADGGYKVRFASV